MMTEFYFGYSKGDGEKGEINIEEMMRLFE